jgi:two-component system cell cycle response regulator
MALAPVQKILLIANDAQLHRLVEDYCARFRGGPWVLDWTEDPAKGLKLLQSGRYAVCLLDSQLGGTSGLDLLRTAGGNDCPTPVVFLAADASDEINEAAMEVGAMDYLVKEEITLRMVEHAIRYARKLGATMSRLRQLATHDALTGLCNRREFERMIAEEWQRSTRFGHPFALVMADIDHFKRVNDTHGHQVGDLVLQHVSSLLSGQIRVVDRVCRYGGEEFAIIMVETDRRQAVEGMERLFALLAELPCTVPGKDLTLPVTLSAGVAVVPDDVGTVADLIAAADEALYGAKHAGRNRIVTSSDWTRQKSTG